MQKTHDVASSSNAHADDYQDGVRTPPDVADGARTPSDWELASEDGDLREGIDDRIQEVLSVQLESTAGQVSQNSRLCQDVHPLAKRCAKPYASRVKALLEKEFPFLHRKVRIESGEVMKLWVAWCEYWEKRSKEKRRARRVSVGKRVARSGNSLGSVLLGVFARANGRSVDEFIDAEVAEDYVFQEAVKNMAADDRKQQRGRKVTERKEYWADKLERIVWEELLESSVQFDCSMLQVRHVDAAGKVKWRAVSCDKDPDDFDGLWTAPVSYTHLRAHETS